MTSINHIVKQTQVIPVITITKEEQAIPLANALLEGGMNTLEVTLRTPAAMPAIKAIKREFPQVTVGAGTVISSEQFHQLLALNVDFAVSPGLTPLLAEAAVKTEIPYLPGISTLSELMRAREMGFNILKFFPAEICGGASFLRSVHSLFPDISFCPTGGINPSNMLNYLALNNVPCIGGTWMVKEELVDEGRWVEITKLAKAATGIR